MGLAGAGEGKGAEYQLAGSKPHLGLPVLQGGLEV